MAEDTEEFQGGDSGASSTFPQQCSALRKGGHVMIKGHPCKIVEMSTSKTGKHGHAKVHLVGIDIFDQKKYEDICPSTHNMSVPIVKRNDYQLIDIDGEGFLSLMDDSGQVREDIRIDEKDDLGKDIKKRFEQGDNILVTVQTAVQRECAIGIKNAAK